jgi:plasmid stability protein
MAMTLRLDEATHEALRARAALEGRSMQEVAREAIDAYLTDRQARLRDAVARITREDAELLDRLSR